MPLQQALLIQLMLANPVIPPQIQQQMAGDYVLHHELARGGQGIVYAGSRNYEAFAIKIYLPIPNALVVYQSQVDILSRINFPHLINLAYHSPNAFIRLRNAPEESRPIVVLQLADGLDLFQNIYRMGRFTPDIARYYAKQLIATVRYLVNQNIAHRDIKLENILLDAHFNLKLCDFGLARDARGDNGDGILKSRVGTSGYKAPEVFEGKYKGIYVDIFAIGVALFLMVTGSPPFFNCNDSIYKFIRLNRFQNFWQEHQKGRRGRAPRVYPKSFKRLIESFLSVDPERRPTFQSLQNDQWWNQDTPTENQVQEYMRERYDRLNQPNVVQNLRRQLLVQMLRHQGNRQQGPRQPQNRANRFTESKQTYSKFSIDERFVKTCRDLKIQFQDLPQYSKRRIRYFKYEPSFIVAWVKDILESQFLNKQVYLKEYVGQIIPKDFNFSYQKQTCEIQINLLFQHNEENDSNDHKLELFGQLHRSNKNEVGIQWRKQTGNFFWLSSIQARLNERLQMLTKSQ